MQVVSLGQNEDYAVLLTKFNIIVHSDAAPKAVIVTD